MNSHCEQIKSWSSFLLRFTEADQVAWLECYKPLESTWETTSGHYLNLLRPKAFLRNAHSENYAVRFFENRFLNRLLILLHE